LGHKSPNTIRKHIYELWKIGLVEGWQKNKFAPYYIRPTGYTLLEHPIILGDYALIYALLKPIETDLINRVLIGKSYRLIAPINSLKTLNLPLNHTIKRNLEEPIKKKYNIYKNKENRVLMPYVRSKLIALINSLKEKEINKLELDDDLRGIDNFIEGDELNI
jgi:hypothetical protein